MIRTIAWESFHFIIREIHFNLIVKLLSDRFGIQVRGGCACAGTYGHFLLEVSYDRSHQITEKINHGDLSEKPGWVRVSLHPVMTDEEVHYFMNCPKRNYLKIMRNGKKIIFIILKKMSLNIAPRMNSKAWMA